MRPTTCAALLVALLSGCTGPSAETPGSDAASDAPSSTAAHDSGPTDAGRTASAGVATDLILASATSSTSFENYTGARGVVVEGRHAKEWLAAADLSLPVASGAVLIEASCDLNAGTQTGDPAYFARIEVTRPDGRILIWMGSGTMDSCQKHLAIDRDTLGSGHISAVSVGLEYRGDVAMGITMDIQYAVTVFDAAQVPDGYSALD